MKSAQKGGKARTPQGGALTLKKSSSGTMGTGTAKKGNSNRDRGAVAEKQGPTDWSTHGLKSKYRGEREREDAWKLWRSAFSYAQQSIQDHQIVPVVKVERHPLLFRYHTQLGAENAASAGRTRARLMQKRFVQDVQEVWLANLEHLRYVLYVYMLILDVILDVILCM
jgi:hypothetical protein